MPELLVGYLNNNNFLDVSFVTQWINISSANSMYITTFVNKDAVVRLDYAVDDAFEIIKTENTDILAGITNELFIPVKSRFLRISVINLVPPTNIKNQVFFFDTSVQTNTTLELGNTVVSTSNKDMQYDSYGALSVESLTPQRQYLFIRALNGSVNPQTFEVPYSDIFGFANNANAQILFLNNMVRLTGFNTPGEVAHMAGSGFKYRTGQGAVTRFSACFFQGPKDPGGPNCTIQQYGIGNILPTDELHNFIGFGYFDDTVPYDPDTFGAIWNNNTVTTFIKRTEWNRDRANGLDSSLNITSWETLNIFQIERQFLGGGNISFFVMNKFTSRYTCVHVLELASTLLTTNVTDPAMGMIMRQEITAGSQPLSTGDYISSGSFGMFLSGKIIKAYDRFASISVKTAVSAEENIISLKCLVPFYSGAGGTANHDGIIIDFLSIVSSGTKPVIVNVYRNCILTTPTFVPVYEQFIAAAIDTVGVFGGLGTGFLLYSFGMSKEDSLQINLKDLFTRLDPDSFICITCSSTSNTDVSASVSYISE